MALQFITDFFLPSAVSPKNPVHSSGKSIQVHLIKLVFQKLFRLKSIHLIGTLPFNQPHTGKTVAAWLSAVKHTAAGPHPFQEIVLLKHQDRLLYLSDVSLTVQIEYLRKELTDIPVIFMHPVKIPDVPIRARLECKTQTPVFPGRQLVSKIRQPLFIPFISAHDFSGMKALQAFLIQLDLRFNLNLLPLFIEIFRRNDIISHHRTDRIQDTGFSGTVLSHQDQYIFNFCKMDFADRFEMINMQFRDTHMSFTPFP